MLLKTRSIFFGLLMLQLSLVLSPYLILGKVIQQPVSNQNGAIEINLRRAKALMDIDIDSAQSYLMVAQSIADSAGNMALQAEIGRQLGNSYWSVASYNLALEHYLKVLSYYEALGNYRGMAMIYNNLGEVYKKLNDHDEALIYHNKSLATKLAHLTEPPLMSYYNLGEIYHITGNLDTAQYFYKKVLKEVDPKIHQSEVAYAYAGLGKLNIKWRRMPVAVDFFEKSLHIRKTLHDQRGLASSYLDLAQVYSLMARHAMAARAYLDSANTVITRINATDLMIDLSLLNAKVDSIRGDYLSAMKSYQRHHFLKDSLYSLQKTYQINELLTNYELEKTRRENQALIFERDLNAAQLKSNSITITIISAGLIIAILLGVRIKVANHTVKEQKSELTRKADDLEQALEHLAAKNEENKSFSYAVSHDLKAPIRVISYYSKMLRDEWNEMTAEEIEKHLDGISNNLTKMQTIISDMLDLSRVSQSSLSMQPLRLDQLAWRIINDFKAVDPTRRIEIDIEKDLNITADPAMVEILLKNLIENAWKYTLFETSPKISLVRHDQHTFVISDNGTGFDMNYYDKLFVPFKRLHGDSEFEGTGIGLSIAKRIVDKHGGEIWAKSKINEGSQFFFRLLPKMMM